MRPHVHALYAFMRYADEIVDNPGESSLEEQLAALEAFEQETMAAVAGEAVPNPVLRAYANTVRVRGIAPEDIATFMNSMKMDTRVFRYRTYEDLAVYTYGSAAVVGLMMCRVVGVVDRRADLHAETWASRCSSPTSCGTSGRTGAGGASTCRSRTWSASATTSRSWETASWTSGSSS